MNKTDNLLSLYSFKEESLLKQYIWKKTQYEKERYTLKEILEILKNIIRENKLYDIQNTCLIIIKGNELENVLKMGCFHVCQVKEIILMHLKLIERKYIQCSDENMTMKVTELQNGDSFYIEKKIYNILDGFFDLRK